MVLRNNNASHSTRPYLWIVVCSLLVLAPFIAHFLVAQPVADDLYFANRINHHIDTLHSDAPTTPHQNIFLAMTANRPVLHFVVIRYLTWSGRFTSDFLIALWVVWFGSATGYPLVLLFLYGIIGGSIYLFVKALGKKRLSSLVVLSYTLFSCAWWSAVVPAPNEILYWVVATLTYMAPIPVLLFTLWYLWKAHTATRVVLCFHTVALCVLAFLLTGFNEAFMTLLVPIFVIGGIISAQSTRQRILAIGAIVGALVGAALVVASPGNAIRVVRFPFSRNIWLVLGGSVGLGGILSVLFVFSAAALNRIPAVQTMTQSLTTSYASLYRALSPTASLWVCLLYLALPSFTLAPLLWGGGGPGPLRVYGPTLMLMILGWPLFISSLSAALHSRRFPIFNRLHNGWKHAITKPSIAILFKAVVVLALVTIIIGVPPILIPSQRIYDKLPEQIASGNYTTLQIINLAANDLVRGNIRQAYVDTATNTLSYYHTLRRRSRLIQEALRRNQSVVELPPFQRIVRTVFIDDILGNPNYYYNRAYAAFYGVKAVKRSESYTQ